MQQRPPSPVGGTAAQGVVGMRWAQNGRGRGARRTHPSSVLVVELGQAQPSPGCSSDANSSCVTPQELHPAIHAFAHERHDSGLSEQSGEDGGGCPQGRSLGPAWGGNWSFQLSRQPFLLTGPLACCRCSLSWRGIRCGGPCLSKPSGCSRELSPAPRNRSEGFRASHTCLLLCKGSARGRGHCQPRQ